LGQKEPENLNISDGSGILTKIDRSIASGEGYRPRYARLKVGHPASFIEAFVKNYREILEVLTENDADKINPLLFGL